MSGALLAAVFIVYRAAFAVGFLNEDYTWLWHCRLVAPTTVWTLLTRDVLGGLYSWRPVVQLSFGMNEASWGLHVFGFRLGVLAWQGLAAGLLYAIVTPIAGRLRGGLAAVLFCVHPLHVESLSWTCARGGPIATLLLLLALRAYMAQRADAGIRPRAIAWTLAAFLLALATLETSIVFVGLLCMVDLLLPAPLASVPTRLPAYAGLLVVTAGYLWLRQASSPASSTAFMVGLDARFPFSSGTLMFVGHNLVAVAAMLFVLDGQPQWLVASLSVAMVLAAVLCWWRGRVLALWGVAWVVVAAAPFTLVLLGPAPRHLHLATVGFGLLCAELLATSAEWLARGRRQVALVCAMGLLILWLGRMVLAIDQQAAMFVERGHLADALLADLRQVLPRPRAGSELAFYGLGPLRAERGVFVYGFEDAVHVMYDDGSLRIHMGARGSAPDADYHLAYEDGHLILLGAHG